MSIKQYLDIFEEVQKDLLYYIEHQENAENNFQKLSNLLEDHKIKSNKHELRLFLHLL